MPGIGSCKLLRSVFRSAIPTRPSQSRPRPEPNTTRIRESSRIVNCHPQRNRHPLRAQETRISGLLRISRQDNTERTSLIDDRTWGRGPTSSRRSISVQKRYLALTNNTNLRSTESSVIITITTLTSVKEQR
jgi:hypothetical protein